MSWLNRLAPVATRYAAGEIRIPLEPQIEAWTDRSHLEGLVFEDITGVAAGWIGRDAAMRVPAVARARHLTCGTIARLPLVALRGDTPIADQPYWLYGTDGQLGDMSAEQVHQYGLSAESPYQRMLWTVDDLFFGGLSLWLTTRADPETGRPLRAAHVPSTLWQIDTDTRMVLDQDGQPFPAGSVILIGGAHEGILSFGAGTIGTAAALERTVADVARRPIRLEAHQTSDAVLDAAERRAITTEIRAAMADNNGVLFTNSALELKVHRIDSAELLIPARNASALDIARHASLPGAMLDATSEGASLEYSTLAGRNQQWLDYGLSLYSDPIAARFGMDDLSPAGQRVNFDTSSLTALDAPDTGPAALD